MSKALKIIVLLPALLFTAIGLRILVDPAGALGELGMPLLDGLGRSNRSAFCWACSRVKRSGFMHRRCYLV